MQNIERYFGYKVLLTDELDPARVEVLKEKAEKIRALNDFSEDEYIVYFHQMSLLPVDGHFSNEFSIEEKIGRLDLTFSVNPKQVKNGKIKLFNYLLDKKFKVDQKEISHVHQINYMLQGSKLEERYGFRNEIVTFVNKSLRKDHRKLKVSVSCQPTTFFKEQLHKQVDTHLTQIDFKLDSRNIELLDRAIKEIKTLDKNGDTVVKNTYNNYGQVAAQGENANSSNTTLNQQVNSSLDMDVIIKELSKLRSVLKATADSDNREQDKTIGAITLAEESAEKGDQDGV